MQFGGGNGVTSQDYKCNAVQNTNGRSFGNADCIFSGINSPPFLQMAVAAAIGVGTDDDLHVGLPANDRIHHNRLKMQQNPGAGGNIAVSSFPVSTTNNLGEINRSIEKMSIRGGGGSGGNASGAGMGVSTNLTAIGNNRMANAGGNLRRDSNWTNSTEGYGSMRSSVAHEIVGGGAGTSMLNSRRCSEVSAMSQGSNFSTTAVRNSPWVSETSAMSTCSSSRRSSLAGTGISGHLSRLHQKVETVCNSPVPPHAQNGRMSSMSGCSLPPPPSYGQHAQFQQQQQQEQQQQQLQGQTRRASDPVRLLDRNFGVGGQMSKHRSYTNLSQSQLQQQQQRVPLHGQHVHGMGGGNMMSGMPQQHGGGIHNGNPQVCECARPQRKGRRREFHMRRTMARLSYST